jgi:hypothetical protein
MSMGVPLGAMTRGFEAKFVAQYIQEGAVVSVRIFGVGECDTHAIEGKLQLGVHGLGFFEDRRMFQRAAKVRLRCRL